MSKPSAPKPPDPAEVAGAQTANNVSTAIANSVTGRVDQYTPTGSLTHQQTGVYDYVDPNTGETYELPTWAQHTSLSPEEQYIFDINQGLRTGLGELGLNQLGRASGILSENFNPDLPDVQGMNIAQYDMSRLPSFQEVGGGPSFQEVGGVRGLVDYTGPSVRDVELGRVTTEGFDPTRSYDFEGRERVENALLERLNTGLDRDWQRTSDALAQQGVTLGSEAYGDVLGQFGQNRNDARLAAIGQAGDEYERGARIAHNLASFENQAAGQGFNQQLAGQGFNNQALMSEADYDRLADMDVFQREQATNARQFQAHQQALQAAALNNQSRQMGFQNELAGAGFNNQARQMGFGNELSALGFNNQTDMARHQAEQAARDRSLQEQYFLRTAPLNEITSLMGGSQVSMPQFGPTVQSPLPTVDRAGMEYRSADLAQQAYQQQMANWGSTFGGLMGLGGKLLGGGLF